MMFLLNESDLYEFECMSCDTLAYMHIHILYILCKYDFFNENNVSNYMVLDKKKNLKMSSDNLTLTQLSRKVYSDSRLDEIEKCVVLYQMFTYVGNDVYEENIKNYPGKCDRKISENFIINNASVIDYD